MSLVTAVWGLRSAGETVTGGPVRCMNRDSGVIAVSWPAGRPFPSGARDDRSAICQRCLVRTRAVRGGLYRQDVSERLCPAIAVRGGAGRLTSSTDGVTGCLDRAAGGQYRRGCG